MKITKKDLRRLIMENVNALLEQDSSSTTSSEDDEISENFLEDIPILENGSEEAITANSAGKRIWEFKREQNDFQFVPSREDDLLTIMPKSIGDDPEDIDNLGLGSLFGVIVRENSLYVENYDQVKAEFNSENIAKYSLFLNNTESSIPTFESLKSRYETQNADTVEPQNDQSETQPADTPAQTSQPRSSSTARSTAAKEKVKAIQKIIDPNATRTQPDGIWSTGTNLAWKSWLEKSQSVIAKLKSEMSTPTNETFYKNDLSKLFERFLKEDETAEPSEQGLPLETFGLFVKDASKAAEYLGFSPTLTGVKQFVDAVEAEKSQDTTAQTRASTADDDMAASPSGDAPDSEEVFDVKNLKLKIDRFQNRQGERISDPNRYTEINLNADNLKLPTSIRSGSNSTELEKFKNLRLSKEKDAIFINNKIRGNVFRKFKLTPVKVVGEYVVIDKPADALEESLSHGALIRRRYRRY